MKFIEIRFKNFLSYGNAWTKICLNSNKSINIIGSNGKGKSVFLDAFHYVLTGKPFRKIKMGQIPNTINKKNCLVELDFEVNDIQYMVRRGINPNVFEIHKNGSPLDEESKTSDFQATLENLCNFNSKNLKHTIIMSSMEYKPILEMTAGEKRLFIDDLLNVDIFTKITLFLKKKLSVLKEIISDKEKDIERHESNLKIIREMNEKAKINNDDEIAEIKEAIIKETNHLTELCENELKKYEDKILTEIKEEENSLSIEKENFSKKNAEEILALKKSIEELTNIISISNEKLIELETTASSDIKTLEKMKEILVEKKKTLQEKETQLTEKIKEHNDRYNEATNKLAVVKNKIKTEQEQLSFLKDNVICLRCKRDIDDSFREEATSEIENNISGLETQVQTINNEFDALVLLHEKCDKFKEKIDEFKKKIKELENEFNSLNMKIQKDKSDINHTKSLIEDKNNSIKNHEVKIKQLQDNEELSLKNIELQIKNRIDKKRNDLINELETIKRNYKQRIQQFEDRSNERIKRLSEPTNVELKDENEILNFLLEDQKILNKEEYKKKIFDLSINFCSDKVIKTYVVKKYIPILNKYVNEYLDILEAPYRLKFDENLDEQIIARGYEKLSYGSFSSGERARCDLAILFAFLEISKMKNSVNSNILILDEVADNSLDKEGISGILSIISRLKMKGYTIFVISHREEMKNEFDVTLVANKDIFSTLEQI